jgi:hypothetical protein
VNSKGGDDVIDVRDGDRDDDVACGTGFDRVRVDSRDEAANNCEKVLLRRD